MNSPTHQVAVLQVSAFFSDFGIGLRCLAPTGRDIVLADLFEPDKVGARPRSLLFGFDGGEYYFHSDGMAEGRLLIGNSAEPTLIEVKRGQFSIRLGPVLFANLIWQDGLQLCVERVDSEAEDLVIFSRRIDWHRMERR